MMSDQATTTAATTAIDISDAAASEGEQQQQQEQQTIKEAPPANEGAAADAVAPVKAAGPAVDSKVLLIVEDVDPEVGKKEESESPAAPADHEGFDFVLVPLSRWQFFLVYCGLSFAILLGALDQTIVATALKSIVLDLNGEELIPWVGSAYILSSASVAALYGKFCDIFGRKSVFLSAIVIFLLGSVVCAVAPSMPVLILGRALAGVGGGGIFSLVMIVISDIVSIRDRGKYSGILGALFGLASVIGPLIGGAFTDHITWRWCFWINLPVGAVTIAAIMAFLNLPPTEGSMVEKFKRVDILGATLLTGAVWCLITPLQLGGSVWDWSAPQTIALFVIAVFLLAAFCYVEVKVSAEPIIPPALFVDASVYALIIIAISITAAFFACIYYISLFFQVSYGDSATNAGLETIPLVFGLVFCSILSGILISKTALFTPYLFACGILLTVGTALVSTLNPSSSRAQQILYLLIAGMGAGSGMQTRILALQSAVPTKLIAIATSVSMFSSSLGGSVGVAVCGTVFNNFIARNINSKPNLSAYLNSTNQDPGKVNLPYLRNFLADPLNNKTVLLPELIDAFDETFDICFKVALAFPIIVIIATLFVKNNMTKKPAASKADTTIAAAH